MSDFTTTYKSLNTDQKKAVDIIYGPVMIIAGPGTGKTTTLTCRIANILQQTDTAPDSILALTFTESGVKAMRDKLVHMIGPTAYYVNIYTFHSFASDIIKEFPEYFLLNEMYEPLSDLERMRTFREIIDSNSFKHIKPFNEVYFYVSDIIEKIQKLKQENVSTELFREIIAQEQKELDQIPEEIKVNKRTKKPYAKYIQKQKDIDRLSEVALVFEQYQNKLKEMHRYDFEDMIAFLTDQMDKNEDLRLTLQERYLFILVDEYQDTNNSQNQIIKLLTYEVENPNIFVVGDDDQAIYRFQGASLENILYFKELFPDAEVITLTSNYRNPIDVINAGRDILTKNTLKIESVLDISKTQSTSNKISSKIEIYKFTSGEYEKAFVVDKIKELLKLKVEPQEIAILSRDNADILEYEDILARNSIRYKLKGGENILNDGDVNRFLNMLKLISNISESPSNDVLLFTVLNYEFLNFDPLDILKLARFASRNKLNLIDAIHSEKIEEAKISSLDKYIEFTNQLHIWHQNSHNMPFARFFEKVLHESGFLSWMLNDQYNINRINRINTLFEEVKSMNYADHTLDLNGFLNTIILMQENKIQIRERMVDSNASAVNLLTAHGSKGLEFKHVFIIKFYDKKWGNKRQIDIIKLPKNIIKNTDISKKERNEDERRLFYVALTRAKERIYITVSEKYRQNNQEKITTPSMFMEEIESNSLDFITTNNIESNLKDYILKLFQTKPLEFQEKIDEQSFLKDVVNSIKINVTSLNTYLKCHYKFKLDKLLSTPRSKSVALSYGTAIHKALELFYKKTKELKRKPDIKFLINEYAKALSYELLTESEYKTQLARGTEVLTKFYNDAEYDNPLYLEYSFGYKKVFLGDIPLSGKIDRIDLIDKLRKYVKVIDYKTGTERSRNYIEGKTKDSNGDHIRQLLFYKLLSQLDKNFNYEVTEGEFVFLETKKNTPRYEIFTYDQASVEDLKTLIRTEYKKMKNLEFERTKDHSECIGCPYFNHCWPDGLPEK